MLTVFTKKNCSYCVAAKTLLESQNIPYKEISVECNPARRAWIRSQGKSTYPQIVEMSGETAYSNWIGGYDEMLSLLEKSI